MSHVAFCFRGQSLERHLLLKLIKEIKWDIFGWFSNTVLTLVGIFIDTLLLLLVLCTIYIVCAALTFFPSFFALIVDFLFTLCLLTNYSNIVVACHFFFFFRVIFNNCGSQFFGSSSCALERICLVFFSVIKTKWKRVFRVGKIDWLA